MSEQSSKKIKQPKTKSTNDAPLYPEVQRNIESGNTKYKSSDEDDEDTERIYFDQPNLSERHISDIYPVIDNDLARDNIENDLSSADLQDL
ncbi:MAG: hypothetical protein IJ300_02795 [Clostridia bacterium]|nr:hypothetical protein [Clostridia bacterium]